MGSPTSDENKEPASQESQLSQMKNQLSKKRFWHLHGLTGKSLTETKHFTVVL